MFPGWFVVPYLLFAVVQLLAVNTLDLYSSGVTLQALGLRVTRVQAVAIDTVLCASVTAIALFSSSFYHFVTDMVLFVMVWLAPWTAVFIVDFLLRRGRYDSDALHATRHGVYWVRGGFRPAAFIALAVGIYRNKSQRSKSTYPFLVDVQSDLLDELQTRVVIPLTKASALAKRPLSNLTPALKFDGETYLLMTPQLAGVARTDLGASTGSLADQRRVIVAAIDFLLMGF